MFLFFLLFKVLLLLVVPFHCSKCLLLSEACAHMLSFHEGVAGWDWMGLVTALRYTPLHHISSCPVLTCLVSSLLIFSCLFSA